MKIFTRIASAFVALAAASSALAFGPVLPSPVMPATVGGGKGVGLLLPNGCTELQVDANLLAALPTEGEFTLIGFPLGDGRFVDLELERFDPLARGATVKVGHEDAAGNWVQEPGNFRPTVACYRGGIMGEPKSMAFLAFDATSTEGFVVDALEHVHSISDGGPDVQGPLVATDLALLPEGTLQWMPWTCQTETGGLAGVDAGALGFGTGSDAEMPRTGCKMIEVAIDSDKDFLKRFSNANTAMAYVSKQMGAFATVYYKEHNLDAQAVFVRLWSQNSSNYPYRTGIGTGTYLADINTRWTNNAADAAQNRDVVALFSGQDLGGGRANGIGGICNHAFADPGQGQASSYCVFGSLALSFPYPLQNQNNANWDPVVFIHEVGHVLGAYHTHDTGDDDCFMPDYSGPGPCTMRRQGTIMSYCHQCNGGLSNINLRFTDRNRAQISTRIGSTACVAACGGELSPGNLVATCAETGVELTWTLVPDAQGYVLYRFGPTDIVPKRMLAGDGAEDSYIDTTVAGGGNYVYHLRALFRLSANTTTGSELFEGPPSNDAPVQAGPEAPTNLQASFDPTTGSATISWSTVASATQYEVWRALGNGAFVKLATVTGTSHTDTVPSCRIARYKIVALASGGCSSADSAEVSEGFGVVDLVATEGTRTDGVSLTWTAVPDATEYKVYRIAGSTGTPSTLVGSVTTPSYLDTTAGVGAFFRYAVVTTFASCTSDAGNVRNGWRNAQAPTNLTATDCQFVNKIVVSWDAADGATKYDLYRAIGDATPTEFVTGLTDTTYEDDSGYAGTPYTYMVHARTTAGDTYTPKRLSAGSNRDEGCRDIGPPAEVSASDGISTARVVVSFSLMPGVLKYRVYRADAAGISEMIGECVTTPFNDNTAQPGVLYTYRMTSLVNGTETRQSAPDTGWRAIAGTTRVAASDGTYTDRVVITWDSVASATGYEIFRSRANTVDPATKLATATGVSYTDSTGVPGTLYTYSVFPRCDLGRTPVGTSDVGWRNIAAPLTVTASDGTFNELVLVQWTAASGATGYSVYRSEATSAAGIVRIGTTTATKLNFSDRTARPGKLYRYYVRSRVTQGESANSLPDYGWRGSPGGSGPTIPGGGGQTAMAVADGGSRGGSGAALTGPGRSGVRSTKPVEMPAPVDPSADPVMAVIEVTDPAWQLDCERADGEALRGAVQSGARDHDANGEPDVCQRARGDLDLSGTVDEGDVALLLSMMGEVQPALGDFNRDGVIDRDDLRALSERIAAERALTVASPPTAAKAGGSQPAPNR